MKKKEFIYLEILEAFFRDKTIKFTQKSLSERLKTSLGLVNKTVKELEDFGIVEIRAKNLLLIDGKKLISFWATKRYLVKDISYSTCIPQGVRYIEQNMPKDASFTAFSAYRLIYNDAPADYGEVYVYANDNIGEFFPKSKGKPNFFAMKKQKDFGSLAPVSLIYVDLWNLKEWYAHDYLKALDKKLFKEY